MRTAGRRSQNLLLFRRQAERLCFGGMVVGLGLEFIRLPLGLTFVRLVAIPPACLGTFSLLFKRYRRREWLGLGVVAVAPLSWAVASIFRGDLSPILTALGALIVGCFTYLYLAEHGWGRWVTVLIASYTLPHLGYLALYRLADVGNPFELGSGRFHGLHSDPNLMCLFILASLAAAADLAIGAQRILWRLLWGSVVVTDLYLVVLSGSRGAVIATATVGLAVLVGRRRWLLAGSYLAVLIAGVSWLLPLLAREAPKRWMYDNPIVLLEQRARMAGVGSASPIQDVRFTLWKRAVSMLAQSKGVLITGPGIETFRRRAGRYSHNTLIDAALAGGVGLASLVDVVWMFGILGSLWRSERPPYLLAPGLLLSAVGVGLLFLSFFTAKLYWFLFAGAVYTLFSRPRQISGSP